MSRTATRLAFADGITGPGMPERYVIFNPSSSDAQVVVAVIPYDAAAGLLPEPFQLDVPARKSVALDLDQQTRIPAGTPHWVRVESVNGVGVAAQRLVSISSGNTLGLKSGLAGSTGSAVSASRWVLPWADRSPPSTSPSSPSSRTTILVANPSSDTIAVVNLSPFAAGKNASGDAVRRLELKPGAAAAVDLGVDGADAAGIVITAASKVVVERRVTAGSNADLSVMSAVPVAGTLGVLPAMSDTPDGAGAAASLPSTEPANTSTTSTTGG